MRCYYSLLGEGMICLSRTDKDPFTLEDKAITTRINFNNILHNIVNGTLHCDGEGETYKLDELCKLPSFTIMSTPSPYQFCTVSKMKLQLNPL